MDELDVPPKIDDGWKAAVWTTTPMQKTTTAVEIYVSVNGSMDIGNH